MGWKVTYCGARLRRRLPVTIDSIRAARCMQREQLNGDQWYVARPLRGYGPVWKRVYHAWLVLTNRAGAYQYARDHLAMAKAPRAGKPG